jgi:transposase-like protein
MGTSGRTNLLVKLESEAEAQTKRRRRSVHERRKIVEESLAAGASVARVARAHGVNANQVFYWRTLYRRGRLGGEAAGTAAQLPVTISDAAVSGAPSGKVSSGCEMEPASVPSSWPTLKISRLRQLIRTKAVQAARRSYR